MAGLKEIRIRIASVSSTQQITSAMKMVSAAKLKRAQDAIQQMRPYADKLREILANLTANIDSSEGGVYAETRAPEKVLLIVVTSNRGLCGGFNSYVIKKTLRLINEKYVQQHAKGNLSLVCVGKKGADFFKKYGVKIISTHNELFDTLKFNIAAPVAEKFIQGFLNKEYDRIDIIYNQFKNAAVQITSAEQFLPVPPPAKQESGKSSSIDYIFEPEKEVIAQELIPRSLKTQFYKALLDSNAAEHGARMTAMHKATDNARDLIRDLKLHYNKARQASITKEILEIVGGAEALNN